jgi:hypothetical protein
MIRCGAGLDADVHFGVFRQKMCLVLKIMPLINGLCQWRSDLLASKVIRMLGVLLLLSLVATPEALTLTGGVLLAIVLSVTVGTQPPQDIFVRAPEKQAEFEHNPLKGVKFTADGKMVVDPSDSGSSSAHSLIEPHKP